MQLLSAFRRPAEEVWSITFHQIRFNSVRLIKMAKQREQIRLMTMKLFQPFRGAVVRFFAFHLVLVLFSFIPLEGHLVWLVSLFRAFLIVGWSFSSARGERKNSSHRLHASFGRNFFSRKERNFLCALGSPLGRPRRGLFSGGRKLVSPQQQQQQQRVLFLFFREGTVFR